MEPYYNYSGIQIYCGNALEVLGSMEAESAKLVALRLLVLASRTIKKTIVTN